MSDEFDAGAAFAEGMERWRKADQVTREREFDRLARLSPGEYGIERGLFAEKWGLAVKFLDQERDARRRVLFPKEEEQTGGGEPLVLKDIEPAEEPVDGGALLVTMTATFARYTILPPHGALAMALWVLRAYLDDIFDTSPRLALTSPEKRCGKTTIIDILLNILPRPLTTSNISAAVLYRTIGVFRPTLLIDELDSMRDDRMNEMRGIINSGHRRAAANAIRCVGDDHTPKLFSTWCPMVLATIGRLPDTILDRSIHIPMKRKAPSEKVEALLWSGKNGDAIRTQLHALARACARWAQDYREKVRAIEPVRPKSLNDRQQDNWHPLLAIAEGVGSEWPERARKAALALSGKEEQDSSSDGIHLLSDVRDIFTTQDCDRLGSEHLCNELARLEERPWPAYGKRGKPISQNELATLLRPYGVLSESIRISGTVMRGYYLSKFQDAFERYLTNDTREEQGDDPPSGCYSATTRHQCGDEPLFQGATEEACSTLENSINPAPRAECSSVALQKSLFQEEEHIEEVEL